MKYDDMIAILEHLHQYVPTETKTVEVNLPQIDEKIDITKTEFHTILFGGDQLTSKRARGSQMIRSNSVTSTEQINGLLPCTEDWHARLCLLEVSFAVLVHNVIAFKLQNNIQVIWKRLYKATSGSDHGTLYQLRNLVQRRNVGKQPKKDFNAHHDFFNVVVTSHILAAAMEVFGMDSLEDEPCEGLVPPGIDTMAKEEREEVLQYLVGIIVDSYIDINHYLLDGDSDPHNSESDVQGKVGKNNYDHDSSVEVSGSEDDEKSNCDDVTSKDDMEEGSNIAEKDTNNTTKSRTSRNKDDEDYVKVYAEEVLTLGMIYSEYSDAIREGDGLRVMRCWKFLMLLFKAAQRKIMPVKHSTY